MRRRVSKSMYQMPQCQSVACIAVALLTLIMIAIVSIGYVELPLLHCHVKLPFTCHSAVHSHSTTEEGVKPSILAPYLSDRFAVVDAPLHPFFAEPYMRDHNVWENDPKILNSNRALPT